MSLSIYGIHHDYFGQIDNSLMANSQRVFIQVYKNNFYNSNKDYLANLDNFYLLNLEPIVYSFSHSWTEGPGAKLVNKINSYMGDDIIKFITGGKYLQNTQSDEMSQKVLESTSPLKVSLKTRCFNPEFNAGKYELATDLINYIEFIYFLILATAPFQFDLSNYSNNFENFIENVKTLKENGEIGQGDRTANEKKSSSSEGENNGSTNISDKVLTTLGNMINKGAKTVGLGNYTWNNNVRGNFTFNIKTQQMNGSQISEIDWILNSWSFKPSTQTIMSNNIPYPLWIDFSLEFETNLCLSNMQIYNLFIKT